MTELLITSSLLILIILALHLALKGRISLRLQYGLWALVLLRLLMPVSLFHSGMSVMNSASTLPAVQAMEAVRDYDRLEFSGGTVMGYTPSDYFGDNPAVIADGKIQSDFETLQKAMSAREILGIVWKAGIALFALVFLVSNVLFASRLKKSRVFLSTPELEAAHPALRRSSLPVYMAEGLPSPCLYGLFRPAIYLTPESLSDETRLEHILTHEAMHYRHGDSLWALLRVLCLCVYWFSPFVWLAAVFSKRDGELACDEATIAALGEESRIDYGRTLLALTCKSSRPGDVLCTATTMTGGKRSLRQRVTLIANKPRMLAGTLALVLLISALAVGCTFTGSAPAESPVPTPMPTVTPVSEETFDIRSLPENIRTAADDYAGWCFETDSAELLDYKLTEYRITDLRNVYTYETDSGPLTVYRMNFEYFSEAPESIMLTGGMYVKDDGWVCLGYPDSAYLIFNSDGEHLLTTVDNDCLPGSPIFTNDMNLLFEQRGIDYYVYPTPELEDMLAFLDGIDWKKYEKENGDALALIKEVKELIMTNDGADADQMRILLTATAGLDSLDSACTEAYGALVATLYINYSDTFIDVFNALDKEQRGLIYGYIKNTVPTANTSSLNV